MGISVSRVGSAAQTKAMKKVAGPLKLDLAQYRELAAFAQFASDLDKATRDQLNRGERISEVIKQPQFSPLPVERQVAILWVVTNGYLDDIDAARVREFEEQFYRYLDAEQSELMARLAEKQALDDEVVDGLRTAAADLQGNLHRIDRRRPHDGRRQQEDARHSCQASARSDAASDR